MLILASFILLIISILIAFIVYPQFLKKGASENTKQFTKEATSQLEKHSLYFNGYQFEKELKKINNESLPKKERYEALKGLSFHFASAYSASHDPELRKNAELLRSFTADNFPEYYKDESGIFELSCSDPTCGDRPDKELLLIRDGVLKLNIKAQYLDTIIYNFDQSMYIPVKNIDEKLYGFNLVISDLESENNQEASAAAKKLKEYVITKYSKYINN